MGRSEFRKQFSLVRIETSFRAEDLFLGLLFGEGAQIGGRSPGLPLRNFVVTPHLQTELDLRAKASGQLREKV